MKTRRIRTVFAVIMMVALTVEASNASFTLTDNQHLDVITEYYLGSLFDSSTADVHQGGCVWNAYVNDNAVLRVLDYRDGTDGLSVGRTRIKGNGQLIVSGGKTGAIDAEENSRIMISGGETGDILAFDNSHIDLFGGAIPKVYVGDNSTLNIYADSFILGSGLSLEGNRLLGTGILSRQWLDGTSWTTQISGNAEATVMLIPEPATLLLLGLGGLMLRKRKTVN